MQYCVWFVVFGDFQGEYWGGVFVSQVEGIFDVFDGFVGYDWCVVVVVQVCQVYVVVVGDGLFDQGDVVVVECCVGMLGNVFVLGLVDVYLYVGVFVEGVFDGDCVGYVGIYFIGVDFQFEVLVVVQVEYLFGFFDVVVGVVVGQGLGYFQVVVQVFVEQFVDGQVEVFVMGVE